MKTSSRCCSVVNADTGSEEEDNSGPQGVVLGIDAAWTENQPSGVALVRETDARWECVAVAPSYAGFIGLADGRPIDWSVKPRGTSPQPDVLIAAARKLAGRDIDIISADIPLATVPITSRREADKAVSKIFGKNWCGTHSPNADRPGLIGEAIRDAFKKLGYSLATKGVTPHGKTLIECYPHPALLILCNRDRRLSYKVDKYRLDQRSLVADELGIIIRRLDHEIPGTCMLIPALPVDGPLAGLKRWEDAVDALVAAWVGTRYLESMTDSYGDATAAIWISRRWSHDGTGA